GRAVDGPLRPFLTEFDCLSLLINRPVRLTARLKTDYSLVFRRLQHHPKSPRIDIGKSGHLNEFCAPLAVGDVDLGNRAAPAAMLLIKSNKPRAKGDARHQLQIWIES